MCRDVGTRRISRTVKGAGLYGAQVESNMLNYDLTPAKWASGNSTMRFSVENCPKKRFFREILEISTSMTWQPLRRLRRLRKLNFVIEGNTSGKVEKTIF